MLTSKKDVFIQALEERRLGQWSLLRSFEKALEVSHLKSAPEPSSIELTNLIYRTINWIDAYYLTKMLHGNNEPAYHNRQHFSDACLALSFFLKDIPHLTNDEKLLLLLTSIVHDFGHTGLISDEVDSSHEARTIHLLKNSPLQKLDFQSFRLICSLILGTKPDTLNDFNQRYLNKPNQKEFLMQALINDADIATSFISSQIGRAHV